LARLLKAHLVLILVLSGGRRNGAEHAGDQSGVTGG